MSCFEQSSYYYIATLLGISLFLCFILIIRNRKSNSSNLKIDKETGLKIYHEETELKIKKVLIDDQDKTKDKQKKKIKNIAVIHFDGDIKAKEGGSLASFIDEIEINKSEYEEVVVVINSPGGAVPHYGYAYSQLLRVRDLSIPLTVCVDIVAASGGYLMAIAGNKIIASPFAIVGSVGVMAFMPNFRKLLQKWKINPRTFTAGNYKRTVTLTDDGSPEAEKHFQEQIEAIHKCFISELSKYRPQAKMDIIKTGDHWSAGESVELGLGLVDELGESSGYLLKRNREFNLIYMSKKKSLFGGGVGKFFSTLSDAIMYVSYKFN